jgi:hypothetical protein
MSSHDADGNSIISIVEDITERKQAGLALARKERFARRPERAGRHYAL